MSDGDDTVRAAAAAILDTAVTSVTAIDQDRVDPGPSIDSAYDLQCAVVAHRRQRGERLVGVKMGFTSRAKAAQMGVHDVIIGQLTDRMLEVDGGVVDHDRFIHPRVEPEVAFLLGQPLSGVITAMEAAAAVVAIAPALEIIDSRFADFRFSLATVVADNASAAGFVVGSWVHTASAFDAGTVDNLGMVLSIDGTAVGFGSTAAILGHPLRSLVAAARMSALLGGELAAGSVVLAGGATSAAPLPPDAYVELEVERLGRASFTTSSRSRGDA